MQIDFKVDDNGTVHKIVTADPVVTDTVIDPFGFDAEVVNLQMANTDDQNVVDRNTKNIADRQAQITALKAVLEVPEVKAVLAVAEPVALPVEIAPLDKLMP